MAAETFTQIRTWIDTIFKSNGRKFITGAHANEGFKKVLAKTEELQNSKGMVSGIASLGEDGKVPGSQLPAGSTDELAKVGAGGTADYLSETFFQRTEGGHIMPKITEGKILVGGEDDVPQEADMPEASGGGSAYLLTLSTITYNADSTIKTLKQQYVDDPTKYFEQRFEYTAGLASKIEIKDDINAAWVSHTNIYNGSGQLQAPTITAITAWTII